MATTGLPLGQSFGAVAGNVTSGSLNAVSEFVPFAWDSAVEAAPGAWDSFAEWTTGVWDAAANDATFDLAA
ncbi:MAG: hypothetical protein KDI11_05000 [Alphaproteobacteria bacterium]|nr:hypothetical protein [Alphaproteobacteria bacterium]